MRSPEGQEFENLGCYLEVVPNERLTWTSALGPGFRPARTAGANALGIAFTAATSLARHPQGTKYTAQAKHGDAGGRNRQEQMGFDDGWGKALEQLVAVAKTL